MELHTSRREIFADEEVRKLEEKNFFKSVVESLEKSLVRT